MAADGTLGIGDAARLVGAYAWLEERLYLLVGKWAAESAPSSEPSVQSDAVYFDTVSQHHAWRSRLVAGVVPAAGGADPATFVAYPGEVADRLLAALGDLPAAARRAALAEVVHPWLAERYRHHLSVSAEVSDGPVRRALELAAFDLDRDRSAAGHLPARADKQLEQVQGLRSQRAAELFPRSGP